MTKLNQMVAVQQGVKSRAQAVIDSVYHRLQKTPLFDGLTKTYQPRDDEDVRYPDEGVKVQLKTWELLDEAATAWSRMLDVMATVDATNTTVTGQPKVDGVALTDPLPITTLLALEKQLTNVRTLIGKLPEQDPAKRWQGELFQHALDRRHKRDNDVPASLGTLIEREKLMGLPVDQRRQVLSRPDVRELLARAGMTWESLAGWLQGPMDAEAWSAVIPSMGYMALLRNLRNFDEAGISDEIADQVIAKLADPEQVARSRQLPFRFYSAYLNAPSLRWGHALDKALTLATGNVPAFKGRTLVLVDTSASMTGSRISGRSSVTPAQAAALFGAVLTSKGGADLYGFANGVFKHDLGKGGSVLKGLERFLARTGEVGHGTAIAESVRRAYDGHDRVIILSDMQTMGGYYAGNVTDAAPKHIPMYGFNLVGYQHGAMSTGSGNRHELGGFSDSTFKLIPLLEAGRNADWPF